ncbi:hypothetical protein FA15DRAFT_655140 [Coprinopsis marcescibilis]|uniref:Uncharacterized protein n=1 Tax=Coprinopsis marcescibilis TaxID=230819 RepID=A0A5C3L039_COPMA|nr:hypothetical protein FA15DRAFT_655140 [Coprinopsis marcescibilis]
MYKALKETKPTSASTVQGDWPFNRPRIVTVTVAVAVTVTVGSAMSRQLRSLLLDLALKEERGNVNMVENQPSESNQLTRKREDLDPLAVMDHVADEIVFYQTSVSRHKSFVSHQIERDVTPKGQFSFRQSSLSRFVVNHLCQNGEIAQEKSVGSSGEGGASSALSALYMAACQEVSHHRFALGTVHGDAHMASHETYPSGLELRILNSQPTWTHYLPLHEEQLESTCNALAQRMWEMFGFHTPIGTWGANTLSALSLETKYSHIRVKVDEPSDIDTAGNLSLFLVLELGNKVKSSVVSRIVKLIEAEGAVWLQNVDGSLGN